MLADFGIALAVHEAGGSRITGTGLSLGTPTYMSPEQASGERELDARSDVYALGAVAYEMLAGEPPITGATPQAIVAKLLTEQPTSLRVVRRSIPAHVDAAVERALAKSPVDRFESAGSFAAALSAAPSGLTPNRLKQHGVFIAASIALVVAATVWLGVRGGGSTEGAVRRLAVLPLASARGANDSGLMADGVTRSVIEALTEAGVPVVGHRSVLRYAGSTLPIRDIARELGADAVVVGEVGQSAGEVAISLELTDPSTGQNRWARTYRRPASEVLMLQRESARDIANAIHATVSDAARLTDRRQVNPEAYAAYLLGHRLNFRYTPDALREADGVLARSIALDSTFAPAYAERATGWTFRAWFGFAPESTARAMARPFIDRAVTLDSNSADVLSARGLYRTVMEWDFKGAEADFRRAVALRPDGFTIDLLGWFLGLIFRSQEGLSEIERAVALEPNVTFYRNDLIIALVGAGELSQALAQADSIIAADPTYAEAIRWRAWILLEQGRIAEAEEAAKRFEIVSGVSIPLWRPLLLAHTGATAEARKAMIAVQKSAPNGWSSFAHVYLAMGDTSTTLRILEDAARRREVNLLRTVYFPSMRKFAKSPRAAALRTLMGLPG